MTTQERLEQRINTEATAKERLSALQELMDLYQEGVLASPEPTNYVNNHIHTIYSFSPYSPCGAAYNAWKNGLLTAGIMDHDSVAGCEEFIAAGQIIHLAITCGFEIRSDMSKTPFAGKRINNPDQNSVAYMACHGIPHQNIGTVQRWLEPYRQKRELRNQKMTDNINRILNGTGIQLDYQTDVRGISQASQGGSVTERHLLYALSLKMTSVLGKGQPVLDFLDKQLSITVSGKNLDMLLDQENPMYEYYLLGVLKGNMVEQFYIDATDECPDILTFLKFVQEIGAVAAYPYLGDVGNSVTGDKKTQTFEDAFLDELFSWFAQQGLTAITYMPTRNTSEQLARVISLCDEHEFFQISGEDINTPFQSFRCEAIRKPQFQHLVRSTWALIGDEMKASEQLSEGMFTKDTLAKIPSLQERIIFYSDYAREKMNLENLKD